MRYFRFYEKKKHLQTHFLPVQVHPVWENKHRNKQSQRTIKDAHLVVTGSFNVCVWTCVSARVRIRFVVTWRSKPQETGRRPQRNDWQLIVFGERLGGSKVVEIIKIDLGLDIKPEIHQYYWYVKYLTSFSRVSGQNPDLVLETRGTPFITNGKATGKMCFIQMWCESVCLPFPFRGATQSSTEQPQPVEMNTEPHSRSGAALTPERSSSNTAPPQRLVFPLTPKQEEEGGVVEML